MKRIETMSLWERVYVPEIVRGLSVTGYHFWRNLAIHILHLFGLAKTLQADVTVQYPEERALYPDTFRGRHRLTLNQDDTANCTACFLCAVACPADCIYIEAGEHSETAIEKYAVRYEIDTLRCIYCGLCVEACPCDAVRMDTAVHPGNLGFTRKDFVEDKKILTDRSHRLETEGKEALYEESVKRYRQF